MDVKNLVARIKNHIYWEKIEKGYFDKMDDESFLKMAYKRKLGKELNLDNPETFNEKLQWLKLHDRRPEYTMMVDKFEVKEYVSNIIGKEHIIPTIGVWDSFDDIDFQQLPDKFVLKCTHDSGGLAICKDKESFDKVAAKKKIEKSLQSNFYRGGREWPYKNVIPRIIAEKYMEDTEGKKNDFVRNIFATWWRAFRSSSNFRRTFLLAFYTAMILLRTVLNREIWFDPLGKLFGGWGLYEEGQFTTESIENFMLFVPFSILLLWAFQKELLDESENIRFGKTVWEATKVVAIFSFLIEFTQLLFHLGTFQISDLTYNTLGGAVGGVIYYLGYSGKRKK